MGKYTDDEIRAMKKVTVKIAADYLGISPMMVSLGMRNNLLPIGFATKDEESYGDYGWSYAIVPERLIAYNHGKIPPKYLIWQYYTVSDSEMQDHS